MNAKAWEGRGSVLFRQLDKLGDKAIKVSPSVPPSVFPCRLRPPLIYDTLFLDL